MAASSTKLSSSKRSQTSVAKCEEICLAKVGNQLLLAKVGLERQGKTMEKPDLSETAFFEKSLQPVLQRPMNLKQPTDSEAKELRRAGPAAPGWTKQILMKQILKFKKKLQIVRSFTINAYNCLIELFFCQIKIGFSWVFVDHLKEISSTRHPKIWLCESKICEHPDSMMQVPAKDETVCALEVLAQFFTVSSRSWLSFNQLSLFGKLLASSRSVAV